MKSKVFLFLLVCLMACNPYKGFKGVNKKGMKTNTTPSQELRDDYDARGKKAKRRYKREMKRRKKRLGTSDSK